VALAEVDPPAGAPWQRPLTGRLDTLVVESELLAGNPLGDSPRRPLYVYSSPRVASGQAGEVPSVYVIQGFTGQLDDWFSHNAFEPHAFDRLDAMFAAEPELDAVVVYVDAWTRLGGSQFRNSPATGRYMDYICDEIVPFVDARYPTAPTRDHRGIAGKSSGGYGAMILPMLRPDLFGALASHAGDSLFEACCLPRFPHVARTLRDHFDSSYDTFLASLPELDHFEFGRHGEPLEMYAYAAAYSPDLDHPGGVLIPFEVSTGKLVEDVWERWLQCDPVRMVPVHADALTRMRRIYLDAGRSDEAFLDLGAQAVSAELTKIGAEHTLELFDGRHGGINYRYPGAIRELVTALKEPVA
jgi:hypothetical protein